MKDWIKVIILYVLLAIFGGLFGLILGVIFWKAYLITLVAFVFISALNALFIACTKLLNKIINGGNRNATKKV